MRSLAEERWGHRRAGEGTTTSPWAPAGVTAPRGCLSASARPSGRAAVAPRGSSRVRRSVRARIRVPPARGICGSTRIAARWGLERSADVGLDVVAHHRRLRRVDLEIRHTCSKRRRAGLPTTHAWRLSANSIAATKRPTSRTGRRPGSSSGNERGGIAPPASALENPVGRAAGERLIRGGRRSRVGAQAQERPMGAPRFVRSDDDRCRS